MKKHLLLATLIGLFTFFTASAQTSPTFTETTTYGDLSSWNIGRCAIAAGDFNNDGYPDLLVMGDATSSRVVRIYQNNGASGGFTDKSATLLPAAIVGLYDGTVNWLDYDNDGRLDFLITGSNLGTTSATATNMFTLLYHQKTDGTFEQITTPVAGTTAFTGVDNSSVSIADYNNDGWVDILINGDPAKYETTKGSNARTAIIYKNNGNGTFSNSGINFNTTTYSTAGPYTLITGGSAFTQASTVVGATSLIDFDNNGTLDVLTFGYPNLVSKAYNDGAGTFSNQRYNGGAMDGLPGSRSTAVAWGDFDNDGKLDVAMAYTNTSSAGAFNIFIGDGTGLFTSGTSPFGTDTYTGNTTYKEQSISCADYNNDGLLDILVSGKMATVATTNLYLNTTTGGVLSFSKVTSTEITGGTIPGVYSGTNLFVDINNDGKLDLLVAGATTGNTVGTIKIYLNGATSTPTAPATVTGLTSPNVATASDVILAWNKTTDAVTPQSSLSYVVKVGLTTNGTSILSPFQSKIPVMGDIKPSSSATTGSYTLHNLADGNYYWSVQAINNTLNRSTWATSGTFTVGTPPAIPSAPVVIDATSIGQNWFTANWQASATAIGYAIDLSTSSTFASFVTGYNNFDVGNVTSYAFAGLPTNVVYYYRVRAYNLGGSSDNSNVFSTMTIPLPPAAPVATAATGATNVSFNANWNATNYTDGYYLDVATDESFLNMVTGFDNIDVKNVITFPVTGLTGGTTYYYRVRGYNTGGTASNSNSITALTAPVPPITIAATGTTQTTFTANWTATDATTTGYFIDVASDAAFTSLIVNNLDVTNVTTYPVITGIAAGTAYYYRIRGYNTAGTGVNSNTTSVITIPAAVVATKATDIGLSNFTANWKTAATATGYQIDVASDATFTSILSIYNNLDLPTTATTGLVSGLPTNVTYYYRIRAYNASGVGNNSNTISVVLVSSPAVPTALPATTIATSNLFAANWLASPTAYGYKLDIATDAAFTQLATGYNGKDVPEGTIYLVTDLPGNATYYYRVRAYNTGGESGNSNIIGLTNVGTPVNDITEQPITIVVVQGSIVIEASATITAAYLTDLNGKIIANIKNASNSLTIPTGNNKGIHILRVVTTNDVVIKKVFLLP